MSDETTLDLADQRFAELLAAQPFTPNDYERRLLAIGFYSGYAAGITESTTSIAAVTASLLGSLPQKKEASDV